MDYRYLLIIATIAASTSSLAFADGEHKPKYGGVLTVVKDVEYELVVNADSVTVFVDDHGRKVDTKGATGRLLLLTGSEKKEVALAPVGANALEARGVGKLPPGTKAVATINRPGKPPASARFEIK